MNKWHNFRFRMHWPTNEHPKWWIDLFIVDSIIRETISSYRNKIELWRFHRRAARDQSGHQLTLLCYTTQEDSVSMNDVIQKTESFEILNKHGLLREYLHYEGGPNIEDSSDKNWPKEIQKSWPYFIAGVSEMLLELIDTIKKNVAENLSLNPPFKELTDIERVYFKVNKRLTILWQQEGSHAFFHHINALFGYVPLLAQPRNFAGILASF